MILRPPRSTPLYSSAASDVYKRQGWGRVSDDGSGHYNPDPSEGPWGGGSPILHGSALSSPRPDTVRDYRSDHEVHDGRRQTGRRPAYAGSRLKLSDAPGRSRLIRQPSSRTGKTRRTE